MTTQQAVIRNLLKDKLLGSICICRTVSYFQFEGCIRIDVYSNVSHQQVEYFNEVKLSSVF